MIFTLNAQFVSSYIYNSILRQAKVLSQAKVRVERGGSKLDERGGNKLYERGGSELDERGGSKLDKRGGSKLD